MENFIRKSELLIPGGSYNRIKTAFMYGADVVYAGTPDMSLRVKAKVTLDEIVREYTLLVKQSACISDNKSVILGCIIGLVITIIVLIILDVHSKKKEKKEYLKKIIDLRHKVERKRKEEKEKLKKKLGIKPKDKKVDDDGIEII